VKFDNDYENFLTHTLLYGDNLTKIDEWRILLINNNIPNRHLKLTKNDEANKLYNVESFMNKYHFNMNQLNDHPGLKNALIKVYFGDFI
jgi:hypothetical protein